MAQYTLQPGEIELLKLDVWTAARDGQATKLVSLLWNAGSHVEEILNHKTHKSGSLTTPLMRAACNGHEGVVAVLLNFGVDLEQKGTVIFENDTFYGVTALWCASCWDHFNTVKILIDNGANVDNSTDRILLKSVPFAGRLNIVQYLVEHGADVNAADEHENTCLMNACSSGNYNVVKYLLKMGADPQRKNIKGFTALHFSTIECHFGISKLLVAAGLTPMYNNDASTPLMMAALHGKTKVVEYFISLPDCSRNEHVDALELLGTSFLFTRNPDIEKAYDYFNTAMYERHTISDQIVPKQLIPTSSILAITEKEECVTLNELEEIRDDGLALCIEGIHIRERVLGTKTPELPLSLFHTGNLFADKGDYYKCIDLWIHASNLSQEIGEEFDVSRFAKLFARMFRDGLEINFQSVLLCFKSAESKLNLDKIRMYSIIEKVSKIHEKDIMTCIYLVGIMLQTYTSKEEEFQLNRAVYDFIQTKPEIRNGYTPLHICCDSQSNNNTINMKNEVLFPNVRLCKVLVACGASVNAQDVNNETPLHVVAKCNNFDSNFLSEIILCLLENGAHMDACNKDGQTAVDASTNCIAASIIKTQIHLSLLSLKCLSARAVRKYKMEFEGIIPDYLKEFVELH